MRVLLVEDEPGSRLLAEAVLRRRGCSVSSFDNAEDAWAVCQQQAFDIAVLDWLLPGMDGLELCRRIRTLEWGDRVLLLVVTACDEAADLRAVLAAGADDYIVKPVQPEFMDVRLTIAESQLGHLLERKLAEDALHQVHQDLERRVVDRTAELQRTVELLDAEMQRREKASEALRRSEERYRNLVENMNDVVFSISRDGELRYVSPVIERMTGYSVSEVVGRPLMDLVHQAERDAVWARLQEVMDGSPATLEFRASARDGRVLHLLTSVRRLWEGSQSTGLTGIMADVTERKLLESRLRLAQKMEVLGQFAGSIAHDFNNLSMVILGTTERIRRGLPDDHPAQRDLNLIARTSEDAAELGRTLLGFGRDQALRTANVVLDDLVADVVPMLNRLLPKNVVLRHVRGSGAALVRVDRSRIEQVVINLCVNARDAMPDGGTITIETGTTELDRAQIQGRDWVSEGRFVALAVTDTGIGMSPDTLARVFDPLFTTKAPGKGTGLGLTSVYSTLEQHKGLIDIVSAPGEGTTCYVYLPQVKAVDASAEAVKSDRRTVLIVGSQDELRDVLEVALESLGFGAVVTESWGSALEIVRGGAPVVDLVVSDASVAGASSQELYRDLRGLRPDLGFLFCCSSAAELQPLQCEGDGRTGFVEMPFGIQSLADEVQRLLNGAPRPGSRSESS